MDPGRIAGHLSVPANVARFYRDDITVLVIYPNIRYWPFAVHLPSTAPTVPAEQVLLLFFCSYLNFSAPTPRCILFCWWARLHISCIKLYYIHFYLFSLCFHTAKMWFRKKCTYITCMLYATISLRPDTRFSHCASIWKPFFSLDVIRSYKSIIMHQCFCFSVISLS